MARALILAAGAGSRFGGPKQLAELDGRPMLQRVIEMAAPWQPLVVLGAHADEITRRIDTGDHIVVDDWADGQSASLRAGVAAIGPVDRLLVLLGDMPFVTRDACEAVLAAGGCARATYGGVPGHPVVLDGPVLARVPELRGDRGARDLLRDCATVEVAGGPRDIDTPQDLSASSDRRAPRGGGTAEP
jgi:CTP:molybdopterin cytidylyltransferase MocA